MKVLSYSWLLAICLLLGLTSVHAADFEADHKLVIQINKQDPDLYGHVLSNINNLHKHYGVDNLQVEVVAYGPGIWMLTEDSPVRTDCRAAAGGCGVHRLPQHPGHH
ncbi:MAG: hypothetical protein R3E89_10590 [Thiolinea sp.]